MRTRPECRYSAQSGGGRINESQPSAIRSTRTWAKLGSGLSEAFGEPGGQELVNAQFWLIQTFNGISYGALLFLVGSGLSLIFGVMRIVNLSHGAYFLWGGYIALSVIWATGSWALSLPVAALAVAADRPLDGTGVPASARFRSAAAGAADGGLCLSVPAGRARHLGRQ